MSEVKNISIRGDAASAYTNKRKTRRRKQDGGYDVPSSGQIPLTERNLARTTNFVSKMSGAYTPAAMLGGSAPASAPENTPILRLPASPIGITKGELPAPALLATTPGTQIGGKPKLILEPKKKSMKKLHLAPASVSGIHTGNIHSHKRPMSKTRKIRVNLSGMKKRLTRAKAIHKESRNNDIADIKKKLIEAKLIKATSMDKPDSTEYDMMLRKTYEDYMLLRNRAL